MDLIFLYFTQSAISCCNEISAERLIETDARNYWSVGMKWALTDG